MTAADIISLPVPRKAAAAQAAVRPAPVWSGVGTSSVSTSVTLRVRDSFGLRVVARRKPRSLPDVSCVD